MVISIHCPYYVKICYLIVHLYELLKYKIFTNHLSVSIQFDPPNAFQPKHSFVHENYDAEISNYDFSLTNLDDLSGNKKATVRK